MSNRKILSICVIQVLGICFCVSPLSILSQPKAQEQAPKTRVETNYDEKKDESRAGIGPFELWKPPQTWVSGRLHFGRVDLAVFFSYPGKKIVKPKFVTLILFSVSEGGAYFDRKRELVISTDSDQKSFGQMELVSSGEDAVSGPVYGALTIVKSETLKKDIAFEDFKLLAESQKANIKVGDRKFKLSNAHLRAFKNFASLMKEEGLAF